MSMPTPWCSAIPKMTSRCQDAALGKRYNLDRNLLPVGVPRGSDRLKVSQADLGVDIHMAAHVGRAVRDAKVDQGRRPDCDRLGVGKSFLLEFDPFPHAE